MAGSAGGIGLTASCAGNWEDGMTQKQNLGRIKALSRRFRLAVPLAVRVAKVMNKISYAGQRFLPEIIHRAIWLYLQFTLSVIRLRTGTPSMPSV